MNAPAIIKENKKKTRSFLWQGFEIKAGLGILNLNEKEILEAKEFLVPLKNLIIKTYYLITYIISLRI